MKLSPRHRPSRRALAFGGLAAAWFALLVAGALPAWRHALAQHREVREVEDTLTDLDRWTVAGLWLEHTLPERQAAVMPVWERLFPTERACERLFLDLARIADENGVGQFELHELRRDEMTGVESDQTGVETDLAGGETGSAGAEAGPAGAEAGPSAQQATATLSAYRVRARFAGDFTGVAGFLGDLGRLDRAIAVRELEIMPEQGTVQVNLEMDVYVSANTRS